MFIPHPLSVVEALVKLQSLNRSHYQFGGSRCKTERGVTFIFDGSKGEILSGNFACDLVNIYNVLIG